MFVWDLATRIAIELLKEDSKPSVRYVSNSGVTDIIDDVDVVFTGRKSYEFSGSRKLTSCVVIANKKFKLGLYWDNNSFRKDFDQLEELRNLAIDITTAIDQPYYIVSIQNIEFNDLLRIEFESQEEITFKRIFIKVDPK
jgi:hypothetical protein